MKNVWVGTDWHVWSSEHTKQHPYQSASNIRQLSDSYAKSIQVDDIFIYLGDLCDPAVTDLNELKHFVQNIPGRKILCKGNHDIETDSFYREIGFDDVCDVCVINQVAFSHFPLKVDPDMINVHGHLHSEKRSDVDDANHINAYREDYYKHPIEISELIQSAYDKWLKDSIVHKAVELSDAKTGKVYKTSRVLYLTDIFEEDVMNEDSNDAAIVGQLAMIDTEDRLLKWVRQNIHLGPMGKIKTDIDMVRTHSGSDFDLAVFVHPRLRKLGHFPKLLLFITWEKQNPRPGFVHLMNYWQEMDDSVTWFEVSWRGHEGIHEFDSLDEMKAEILEYYKDTPDAQKYTEAVFRVVPYSYIKVGDNPQDILKKVFEDSGLMDEAVYDFDAYRQKLGTKKIGDIPYDIHKLSTLTKDLLDADILITPESINKARIQEAKNCEDLVSYYIDRITNYYKDETGYLAGIEVLSNLVDAGLTSEPKHVQDFKSVWNDFIPTGLSDIEFKQYINSRMNELDLMESMFQNCILENLELFGIARSEVAMLQKDPANKDQMRIMREQFKKNESKLITTLPDGTIVFSYPRKNFGKVYITKEIYNNPAAKDILTPYRYFSRASQYDYIIISHRTSDSTPDNWKMLPVTIDGYKEPFTNPKKLVATLGKKSRILLNVCNSDGVMLNGYDNVTYSSNKTILESAVLKYQNPDTTMNTKIKTITATQKALKKLQSKIADQIYDRTLVLTPVNSYYAIGITDEYLPSIKQINFNKYDTVQDGYIIFINQIIDQYRDFLEKMKSILDIFVRYYTGTLSETGYQWFGSSTISLGSVYGVNYNRIGRYLPSVRDCIQEAIDSTWYDEYKHSGIYIVNESGKEQYVELPSDINTSFALDESLSNVHSDHCKIMVNDQEYKDDGLVSCIDWFCDTVQIGSQVINIKTTDRIHNLWAITEQDSSPLGGRGVDYSYVIQLDLVPMNIDKFSLMKFVCLFDILVTTADQRTIEAGCPNSLCAAIAYWYSQPYYDQLFELPEKSMHPSEEVQKYFNMIQCYQRTVNDTAVDLLVRDLFWNKEIDPKILISSALKNSMIACSVNNESALSGYEQLLSMEESVKKNKEELNEILMEPEDAHLFMSDDHAGEKSQKPYKARLSTDDEGVIAEDAYQLQGIDRQQQDVISKKYGIRAVGHETDEEREYWEKKEKEKQEQKKLAEKKKKDKQLANARKAKKKYAKKREWEAKKAELKSKFDKKNEDVDISDIPYNTGETNFFGKTGSCFDFENETGYQFGMIDKVKFFDRINESSTDSTLYPVYVLCVHTGTLLANAIKKVTNSHFSHCTIGFDSSLKNMYSFGRKVKMTELSNGSFVKESIKNPPYTNEGVTYALYCIPVTADQIAAMKKRLEYFAKNKTKFRYDFGGLIKNYFGIADNPEQSWFCSRFVADIINAGSEPGKPMIREPSLMRPEDFLYTNFAQYITSGLIKDYDPVLVDKITTKLLRIESIKRAKQRTLQKPELAMTESCILDLNPYDVLGEAVFNYQMATMDETAVDKFFLYLKSFKVRFDKDGNVIIHRREVDQLDKYFREANSLLKANMKAGNEQGVVDQLCRVYYMIALINNHYLNSTTKQNTNVKADLKKELIDLRSVMMNVFQQYLKWVTDRNPQFNFQVAYDGSKYSDTVNIPNKVISDIGKTLITAL